MLSTEEKQQKVKNIVTGLASMKRMQQEAIKKKRARAYIKTIGGLIRTSLWVAPLVMSMVGAMAPAAQAEEYDDPGGEDVSGIMSMLDQFDPELLDSLNTVFEAFDGLGDLLADGLIDSIVDSIDVSELEYDDIIAAESLISEMCSEFESC